MVGEFSRGAKDDDYAENPKFDVNLSNVHTQTMVNGSYGLGASNSQDTETDQVLGALENSRVDPENDQWALAPNRSYGVNGVGRPRPPGKCFGVSRTQGVDHNKSTHDMANSYLKVEGTGSAKVGNWVNPDSTNKSAVQGGTSCDLTGNDWGYAYDPTT